MRIFLRKFVDGLILFNPKGEQFKVKDYKVNCQSINCFLDSKFELTVPASFLIVENMIDLKNFSIIRPSKKPAAVTLLSPNEHSERIIPKL